jgi:hypothetical protein
MSQVLERALAALPAKEPRGPRKIVHLRCPNCGEPVAHLVIGRRKPQGPTEYQHFMREALKRGLSMREGAQLWREQKNTLRRKEG